MFVIANGTKTKGMLTSSPKDTPERIIYRVEDGNVVRFPYETDMNQCVQAIPTVQWSATLKCRLFTLNLRAIWI